MRRNSQNVNPIFQDGVNNIVGKDPKTETTDVIGFLYPDFGKRADCIYSPLKLFDEMKGCSF